MKWSAISTFIWMKTGIMPSASAGRSLLRFLADVYGYASIDDLDEKEKNSTPQELIDFLCENYGIGERTDPNDSSTFVPGQGYTKEEVLKLVTVRYAMRANSYQKYIPTTIATDVSEKTVAAIKRTRRRLPVSILLRIPSDAM